MDHLHQFQEMLCILEFLPAGDIPSPNATLQVEWFYMSIHRSDCSEYIQSAQKLIDEMLNLLAEYFEEIFNAKFSNGLLQLKCKEQIRCFAQNEMHQELEKHYKQKMHA